LKGGGDEAIPSDHARVRLLSCVEACVREGSRARQVQRRARLLIVHARAPVIPPLMGEGVIHPGGARRRAEGDRDLDSDDGRGAARRPGQGARAGGGALRSSRNLGHPNNTIRTSGRGDPGGRLTGGGRSHRRRRARVGRLRTAPLREHLGERAASRAVSRPHRQAAKAVGSRRLSGRGRAGAVLPAPAQALPRVWH
jgi:hypothetical protein